MIPSQTTVSSDELDFNEQFAEAYDLLENHSSHLFITGQAGTGKSTLLQYFRQHSTKTMVVLAPTGVSAVNIKGQTIHSFFRFKPDVTPDGVANIRMRKAERKMFKKIEAIIIDEISMVRADLLDCIDTFLRIHAKNPDAAFGGVQMIFFGDLYQLPPVVTQYEKDLFSDYYRSPYFFDAKVFADMDMNLVELQTIYRQKEEDFIHLLGHIRNDTAEGEHFRFLNKRFLPRQKIDNDDLYIHLTTTNRLADATNQQQLKQLKSFSRTLEGKITGQFEQKGFADTF